MSVRLNNVYKNSKFYLLWSIMVQKNEKKTKIELSQYYLLNKLMIFHLKHRLGDNRTRSLLGENTYMRNISHGYLFKSHFTSTAFILQDC
jgi:hypothetical protein